VGHREQSERRLTGKGGAAQRTFSSTDATSTPAEMSKYDREKETMEREMLVMRYALP
jgi:hypothetical protein